MPVTSFRASLLAGALFVALAMAAGESTQAIGIDPTADISVCTTPHLVSSKAVTTDGHGGALVTWVDFRNDTLGDVYVQRIDSKGTIRWQPNGVVACATVGAQTHPTTIADGSGGAFVAWQDNREASPRVYVQRVSQSGQLIFAADGVPVCTADAQEFSPAIAVDSLGGAFIAWLDYRGGLLGYYLQRIKEDGSLLWPGGGVVVDTSLGPFVGFGPRLLEAGAGQVIALTSNHGKTLTRKFDAQGQPLWAADGVAPCASCIASDFSAAPDGSGGADLVWSERTLLGESRVVAQHISSGGVLGWGPDGTPVFSDPDDQDLPTVVSGGDGGAFVLWRNTGVANPRITAQRLGPAGDTLWGTNGIRVATAGRSQGGLAAAAGGKGDLLVLWQMFLGSATYDIFAQRLDGSGIAQWEADGTRVPTTSSRIGGAKIEPDGQGGATVVWDGVRDSVSVIEAKSLDRLGYAAPLPAKSAANAVFLWSPAPNPANRKVTIRLAVRSAMPISLDVIDIAGRHVRTLMQAEVSVGLHSVDWDGTGDDASPSPSGVYFIRCASASGTLVTKVQLAR